MLSKTVSAEIVGVSDDGVVVAAGAVAAVARHNERKIIGKELSHDGDLAKAFLRIHAVS